MEERLVLNRREARMVKEVAEHETSWLILHPWHSLELVAVFTTLPRELINRLI